ncbi:inovirus-type Gp2 protein [Pseudomonas sp. BF-B-27]|uniref:YagK/YfjJ domain-containing protein n=1 Tax=Pseudomonas sp. BF-B-27 TaxID=2832354 RepID=UPI001CBD3971|nr:inovirus-type Gp2 protein [Pseudomonas sp. BF-B-27]
MSLNEWEFVDAYREKVVESLYDPISGQESSWGGDDGMLFDSVSRIMKLVSLAETSLGDVFKGGVLGVREGMVLTKAQECIVAAVVIDYSELERDMVLFKVNPYVRAVYDCYKSIRPSSPFNVGKAELPECFQGLNDFVSAVRKRISSTGFRREMSAHVRAVNKNYAGLLGYIDALFARYSRLLVLRIDFSYGKGEFEIEDCTKVHERLDVLNLVSEQIVRHRIQLLHHLKSKRPELGMVGYVWKLEYGKEKGHHYHMMFFLDGTKVRKDIVIAKLIGEYWNEVITQGKGVYYNCNGNKGRYKFCGVGMINYHDVERLSNLKERAAIYLTKIDRYVSACMPGNRRTFGKGNAPKASERSVGRPREY